MGFWAQKRWSPYLVGALIGVLSWISFYTSDKPIGVSTTFVRAAGMIEKQFGPDRVARNLYFTKTNVKLDWQWMLVIGIFVGAFLSAASSGDFRLQLNPPLWASRFGGIVLRRLIWAFVGGFLLLFGARMAGGCTSGHGISGAMQLAPGSWAFFASFFLSGLVTAGLMFRGRRS